MNSNTSRNILVLLRLSLGWLMLYAGATKILNESWSAAGYLQSAKTLPALFSWFAQPEILPMIDALNAWGLSLLGVSLLLGLFVRLGGILGAFLMALYYLPILDFPIVGSHSYLVDEHIIYILVLLYLSTQAAGRRWGVDGILMRKFPWLRYVS